MYTLHWLFAVLTVDVVNVLSAPANSACTPGTQIVSGRTCTITCGADRPGGDYGQQHTGSLQGCTSLCAQDARCVSAQYHESNGYCYLKKSKNTSQSVQGVDSIDCAAPQNSMTTTKSTTKAATKTTTTTTSATKKTTSMSLNPSIRSTTTTVKSLSITATTTVSKTTTTTIITPSLPPQSSFPPTTTKTTTTTTTSKTTTTTTAGTQPAPTCGPAEGRVTSTKGFLFYAYNMNAPDLCRGACASFGGMYLTYGYSVEPAQCVCFPERFSEIFVPQAGTGGFFASINNQNC